MSPVFSRDGKKVALWDGDTLSVRAVSADGTFAATLAQFAARPLLRNTSGNFGYRASWNPEGTQLYLMGGHGSSDIGFTYYDGEILGFSLAGTALTPLAGGVLPTGVEPTNPVFPTPDVMLVRDGGAVGGVLAAADVRTYSTSGNELRRGNVVREGQAASTSNVDSFISRDGRYVVAGDSSYSVQGSTVVLAASLPRTSALRLASNDEIEGVKQMRGPFVLAAARRNRGLGTSVFASFRIESDGRFSLIASPIEWAAMPPFVWGSLLEGRVFWITDAATQEVLTLTMNDAGELSAFRRQGLSVAPSSSLCGANLNGRFLYCFGRSVAIAAAVADDGTLTAFSPFAATSAFAATRAFPIAKP